MYTMMLLEVAVAAPVDQTLTYNLPDHLMPAGKDADQPLIGRRVLVPLGRRKVTGYVLGETRDPGGTFTIRDISAFLDDSPLFPANLVEFFRWIAEYYHYPLGETIKTALPAGLTPKSARILRLNEEGRELWKIDRGKDGWQQRLLENGALTVAMSRKVLADRSSAAVVSRLLKDGILSLVDHLDCDAIREKREECYSILCDLPEVMTREVAPDRESMKVYDGGGVLALTPPLKLSECKTLHYLYRLGGKKPGGVPGKELRGSYSGASAVLSSLVERGLIKREERRVFRSPLGEQLSHYPRPVLLTPGQERVLTEIVPAIHGRHYKPFLLHGVTGSGKTEVYLRAAEEAVAMGRDVLVIVPEIAIATQLEAQFVSRFADLVVLQHSGLGKAERFDQYHLALSGAARIVIGARSAVFAPLADPGLIIVDEEHDSSLKQDDGLRYNGRDLAVVRARQNGAVVLLGSATPSVVSYRNGLSGKYRLLTLPERVGDRSLPDVTIIDLRDSDSLGKKSLFRPPLLDAIRENLEQAKQSVILLNRRGYAASVICRECGEPVQCANCNVSLTQHQASKKLLCHYCGYAVHSDTVCKCGSFSLVSVGIGTEKVEQELIELFPTARIARLDADTGRDREAFLKILKEMRDGDIDILVGTQMIAKGLHFPGVTLVGVVWADGGLAIPDYRAAEKTFQLVTQVTGRAGRGEHPGRVFIQTLRPDHYAIALAATHNYEAMVTKELELRSSPQYPPFVRLVTVHIRGELEERVRECGANLGKACRQFVKAGRLAVEVLGPAPSPIDRMKNVYRWQLLLKSASLDSLHTLCRHIESTWQRNCSRQCRVILDIDPENMM